MKAITFFISLAVALVLCGCSTTTAPSANSVEFSGFLGDYDGLVTGGPDSALYRYTKPGLSLAGYTRVIIEQPEILLSNETLNEIDDDDISTVLEIAKQAGESFQESVPVTEEAGPGVLRLRWAITDLKPASKANLATGLLVPGRVISKVLEQGTGTHLFVGQIGIEAELLDSVTGERLMAGVDTRVGANAIRNVGSTWGDVEDAMDLWADRFANNLIRLGFSASAAL